MSINNHEIPDRVLDTADTGDDVQLRFRYQATYAAILSLRLLNEESEFEELFCEHHEDILVKLKNGTFVGVQVKTRKEGRESFKASDSKIIKALKKFIKLEKSFPNKFVRFCLATNCGFWQERKNGSNLLYILELAQNAMNSDISSLQSPLSSYLRRLTDIPENNSGFILNVLNKIEVQDELPKFKEIELTLIREIARIPEFGNQKYDTLQYMTKSLINKMFNAASLASDSPVQYYFALLANPEHERENAIIEGKRITRNIVQSTLQECTTSEALLKSYNPVPLSKLPRGIRIMELKMAAGRISIPNIDLIKDYKYSTEVLLDQWLYRYGSKKANERYEHLRIIVQTECQEVYDLVKDSAIPFGENMLIEVRHRLRDRYNQDRHSLFGCKYEHLWGFSGILTEDCTLWWSKPFDVSEVES